MCPLRDRCTRKLLAAPMQPMRTQAGIWQLAAHDAAHVGRPMISDSALASGSWSRVPSQSNPDQAETQGEAAHKNLSRGSAPTHTHTRLSACALPAELCAPCPASLVAAIQVPLDSPDCQRHSTPRLQSPRITQAAASKSAHQFVLDVDPHTHSPRICLNTTSFCVRLAFRSRRACYVKYDNYVEMIRKRNR